MRWLPLTRRLLVTSARGHVGVCGLKLPQFTSSMKSNACDDFKTLSSGRQACSANRRHRGPLLWAPADGLRSGKGCGFTLFRMTSGRGAGC